MGFGELARAKQEATGLVAATLDPATGVPTKVSIDWVKNAMDDEYAWTVTNFHSLPEG